MADRRHWQRDEALLVLHLYCRTPFGKLHQRNPNIIHLAERIGRTPSAVAMKAVNFAHLDPNLEREGLSSVSQADRELWREFLSNAQAVALEAEDLYEKRINDAVNNVRQIGDFEIPGGPSETAREVKTRLVQQFFRRTVLTSYDNRCAVSGLQVPELVIASHIIPWKNSEERRADPTNGIALNSLYDRAFDKGYMTFDENWRVCLAARIKQHLDDSTLCRKLLDIEGMPLRMPTRFYPDESAMDYHRNQCFDKS